MTVHGVADFDFTLRDLDGKVLRKFRTDPQTETTSISLDNIWLEGRLVGFIDEDGEEVHAHLDHLGTPRLHTDAAGAKLSGHDYFPFGLEITDPEQDEIPMKFTGHERDRSAIGTAAELDYMHARYYSPHWGRFTSVDPANAAAQRRPQTWNRYSYTSNGPLQRVDPDGLYERDVHFHLTRVIAVAAGFAAGEANSLAYHTQLVDEDFRDPLKLRSYGSMEEVHAKFHFVSGARLAELMELGQGIGSPYLLGQALHALQDAYSHRGFNPGIGHLLKWKAPDNPHKNPERAMGAARASYAFLRGAEGASYAPTGFSSLEAQLGFIMRAPSREVRIGLLTKLYRKLLKQRREDAPAR